MVTKSASALVEPDNKVGSTYVSYKVTTIKNWTILKPTFKVTNYGKGNVNIHIYNKDGSIYTSLIGLKPGRSHNFGLPRKHTTYSVSVTAPNNLMGYKIDVDNEVEMPTIKKARRQYSNSVGKIIEQDYDQNLKKILEKIVEIEGGIYNPIFAIQLMINCTGMRINEVIALKPNKLDYTNKTLLVDRSISWHPNKSKTRKSFEETSTKTDGERTILIPDELVNYLKTYINRLKQLSIYSDDMYISSRLSYARNDDYILHPFSLKTFDNHIREAYIKTNLLDENDEDTKTIRNHVARHAFNTKLKNNHIEEYDRKEYIGHSNGTSVNEGYTHKSNKEERRIVRVIEKYILYLCKDIQEFNEI